MRKLTVKKLDREAFRPYGDFVSLLRPAEFYGDAGAGAVTLVAPESDCIHAGTCAFLPDPAYLRRIAREADRPCDDYGVRPGRDCPGTLVPLPWICRGRNGRERRALS